MKTFEDFLIEFNYISSLGFIETMRKGNTGVGHTLEKLFKLKENPISLPDLINFLTELKSKRLRSKSSLLTLFTDDTGWLIEEIDLIEKYGWNHRNHIGEKSLNSTIRNKMNKRGFSLDVTDNNYLLVCKNNTAFIRWKWEDISKHYYNKCANLIVVDADSKKSNNTEYFHYIGFNHYQGTSTRHFRDAIESGSISVDLRLSTQYNLDKGVRNRGTAFRIRHKDVPKLYESQEYFN